MVATRIGRRPALEALHRRVPLGSGHLAVREADGVAEYGAKRFSALFGRGDVERLALIDQRTNPVGARAGGQSLREASHHLVEPFDRQDARIDRLAPRRLLAQSGDIHVAEIGEHERTRDRRRRHHEKVDRLALGGEGQALADAEPMLLVDHREPEIGEGHAFLKQRMRADSDVDRSFRQCGERGAASGRLVASGHERDAQADARRERGHALVVLAGENLGRRHHRRLPAGFDHVRHCEKRNDGLARSDVALQQPQHALFGSEIGADVVDRLPLRARQRKGQGGLEASRQRAFADVRAAGNGAHARAHEEERELVGEQFVIGEPRRRWTCRDRYPRARPVGASRRALA